MCHLSGLARIAPTRILFARISEAWMGGLTRKALVFMFVPKTPSGIKNSRSLCKDVCRTWEWWACSANAFLSGRVEWGMPKKGRQVQPRKYFVYLDRV